MSGSSKSVRSTNHDRAYVDKVKQLIGIQGFKQAFVPIEQASGLPNEAYWSDEWLALEQQRIFQRSWVFAGAGAQIPHAGDVKPVDIGGAPLFIVRGSDDRIRAFHNVCRHRGARLVSTSCQRTVLTCPYHRWSYALDGKILSRPHFFGPDQHDVVKNGGGPTLDLMQVRCDVWHDCVFVNVSGDAQPLYEWLSPLLKKTVNYDFSSLRWAGKLDFELNANWKLVYENYMEGYHVFAVHPKLLKFAPMNVRWSGEWTEHVFYNDYVFPKVEAGRGDGLPNYPNLPAQDAKRGLWFLCFPHFAAEVFPDQFTILVSYPQAPDKTREELHIFLIGDAATSKQHQCSREALIRMWGDLNREDIGMLELLQQGRRSPAYDGGRLSAHWEGPTHEFGRKIVEKIISF